MSDIISKIGNKATSIGGFAKDQLVMIKQVTDFFAHLPKIMKEAPQKLEIASMELEPEDENKAIYLTITCGDETTYKFAKQFSKYDRVLPFILSQAYEKMKSGEFDDLIEQAKEKAQ
jgi:hypothetical protein